MRFSAVLFDCDGVLVDSEPAHFEAFRVTLAGVGLPLTRDDYFRRYLAYDDDSFFTMVHERHGLPLSDTLKSRLIHEKTAALAKLMSEVPVMQASFEFARSTLAAGLFVAVASGSHREEVRAILERGGLGDLPVVVATEDVTRGKPFPDPWLLALERLNRTLDSKLVPADCIAVKDSLHGVRSVLAAGMRVVALTTSYTREELSEADLVLPGLDGLSPGDLSGMLDAAAATGR